MAQVMTAPRDELHSVTDWKAGVWAGVIAGVVFMMLEMSMVWLFMGESPWAPPHMIAAMALGKDVLPQPGTWAPFDMKILITAMLVHFPLSIAYGLIGAWLMHRFDWLGALAIGAAFGLAIYLLNFYLIAPAAFPWFEMARNWISVLAHVIFGAVLGVSYIGLRKPSQAPPARR
jgi:uncharacterized membrane protein YagU involved in acid resistance